MIKHIVMWKLKDEAHGNPRAVNISLIREKLEALVGVVPGLLKVEVGTDFSATNVSADIVLYSEFSSREALIAYQIHPAHETAAAFIREAVTDRLMVDYEI